MSEPSRLSRRYTTMTVAAVTLIALTCVAFLLPVPYVTMRPGPAFDTLGAFDDKPMFTFGKGVKTYPTSGNLDFTTVSVSRADSHVPLADAISAYFDKNVAVVPKTLIYPDNQSAKQSTAESAAQLDGSKDSSKVAALRAAGFTVTPTTQIGQVIKGGASVGRLEAGDVVTGVDGTKVSTPEETIKAVGSHKPGETVTLDVTRKGKPVKVALVTRADPDNASIPRIGVTLATTFTFPFKIDNNVGRSIGGPSAGTMFALAIYDKLTPGSLTGGERVAGTGEMAADGTVGPIGGVRQKMAGAHRAGAKIFLVPAANCAEATDGDDDGLKLVKISTLKDAISSLETLAKNSKAEVPSCS